MIAALLSAAITSSASASAATTFSATIKGVPGVVVDGREGDIVDEEPLRSRNILPQWFAAKPFPVMSTQRSAKGKNANNP